ncbi:Gfo/Idh/MocA family protein [Prosthecomicrobium hirschii]|uniref:Gfo/Idh/MocA family protein n=1 Tax=Prosthecodimorpha hirschii TaxID=665126 RepID=UPI001128D788|nr:Gfo/Idh/MocA family oxidoreductase [Prosthecomicrobium hirschii]MCW1841335.1 Gfo/Idh/MocA family oxidoreductase [Prosthecomicrobium hirschii]TPQ44680.1 gfo/Idh/MocA family oxidoreductase [Prosthecomicrobium hirschii]
MTKLRIGIVGLGMAVTPHARGLMDLADTVEVAHAFSPSAERRAAFAGRFPFPLADSLDAILDDRTVDAVLVLTPANTHLDIVRRCADAGKHVLLEKPIEITSARAEAVVAVCRAAGVTLGIVLQHRFRPAAMTLAGEIATGALGEIVGCSTVIRLWRPQSYYDEPGRGSFARDGGGVLISQGIHTLDLMLSLAGPIAEVAGSALTSPVHRMETEDMVAAAVRYANGAIGTIDATTAAYPGFPERIELIARNATASLVGTALQIAWHDGRRTEIEPDRSAGGTGADPMAFPHDYHRAVMADFAAAVRAGGKPRVTGEEALKVHRLIDALIEAGRTGERVRVRSD